ncbi:MAG TPA: hypothetical protein VH008_10345 [Pseudonocardia sp.]|jgi:hypothetical protein|nr:hypothetical protein [Pseudonocardia sp.]
MSSVLASVVAVVGTLLGVYLTSMAQRKTLEKNLTEARTEKRRQEFADALAAYASACTVLRRAEFQRARARLESADEHEQMQAKQETYRLRAEAWSAYYLVRLLAAPASDGELIRDAKAVIEHSRSITAKPTTMREVHQYNDAATEALDKVIEKANQRLQGASF